MKLDRVVIGIDFSTASIEAAQWITREFASGAELVLVHVISLPEAPPILQSRFPRRDLLVDTVRVGAEKRLREISLSLHSSRMWLEIREGQPAESLMRVAEDFSADLVVVGAHGERHDLAEGLGSTAEHVVRISTRPVILVTHPRRSPLSHILVAAESSEATTTALRWAATLSEALNARVTTIHVAPTAAAATAPNALVERMLDAGITRERAESAITSGNAAKEIIAASERLGSDLVVMGRRTSGNIRRAILGSVVSAVLRDARCPVLVVPE